jgi:hypothetical protein
MADFRFFHATIVKELACLLNVALESETFQLRFQIPKIMEDLHDVKYRTIVQYPLNHAGIIDGSVVNRGGVLRLKVVYKESFASGLESIANHVPELVKTAQWDMRKPKAEEDKIVRLCWMLFKKIGNLEPDRLALKLGPVDLDRLRYYINRSQTVRSGSRMVGPETSTAGQFKASAKGLFSFEC